MVWEAFCGGQNKRLRMGVLVDYLYERASGRRVETWDATIPWLSIILIEHDRVPFHAIVTTAEKEGAPYVLCENDLPALCLLREIHATLRTWEIAGMRRDLQKDHAIIERLRILGGAVAAHSY